MSAHGVEMPNWYDQNIEEPVRELVKLLRENGFNTESSCGHELYVQCQYSPDGELQRLHDLLFNTGYKQYEITVSIKVIDGCLYCSSQINLEDNP